MKNQTTAKISDKLEMVGFIRSIGTECCFVSMLTETEVEMVKKDRDTKELNPYLGTIKVSQRNGLLNVNFVESVRRKLAEQTNTPIKEVVYVPGETWYVHENTVEGKPLSLCVHKKNSTKFYLQYFPHRTLGKTRYFLKGVELTPEQIKDMERFLVKKTQVEYKPTVITLAIDSIRSLRARRINMLNHTVSKIVNALAQFAKVPVSTGDTKPEITHK